jgi:hypothetical protein
MTRVLARNGFEYYPYYDVEGGHITIRDQAARCTYCDSRISNISSNGTTAEPAGTRTRSDTAKEEESVFRQLVAEHIKLVEQRGHFCTFCHTNALPVWDRYHS